MHFGVESSADLIRPTNQSTSSRSLSFDFASDHYLSRLSPSLLVMKIGLLVVVDLLVGYTSRKFYRCAYFCQAAWRLVRRACLLV
ncbi:jg12181 [Pararge aegeria aegeria]|uniref:Jg12181 protein n=1 Tax=Pararge aegeria aegeria TaxID=348720 RepID=A0A8S4RF45_9NEOP|nr:jg12181 [Pararge aegeria aegeria]